MTIVITIIPIIMIMIIKFVVVTIIDDIIIIIIIISSSSSSSRSIGMFIIKGGHPCPSLPPACTGMYASRGSGGVGGRNVICMRIFVIYMRFLL